MDKFETIVSSVVVKYVMALFCFWQCVYCYIGIITLANFKFYVDARFKSVLSNNLVFFRHA